VIRACRAAFDLAGDAEVTLEANPNGLSEECCAGLREAGVNRLSLGAQTLQRRGLRVLGRLHEADDTAAAVHAARAAGFDNLSLDLIFGWPGQTAAAWADDLARVLAGAVGGVPPDHLSLYSLIVEPGTPMHDAVARGILVVLDDDATADLYEAAIATLDAHGWRHYEIANWARRPGFEARHNLIYWRNGEWVGLGAGAHAQLGGRRTMNHLLPRTYIEAIERGELPRSNQETIAPATAVGETMMLGLRLLEEGVADAAFADRHRVTLEATFGSTIADLRELGLLDRLPDRIRLSHRGTLLANDVVARFLA
jgi:oxygen-independent coproporphyrinogen-3 oxidase